MADDSAEQPITSSETTTEKPATNEKKALSIVALVFGILGLISCWAPFFGLICCLVGVVLGIVALVKKHQKGMAIAGLVCGAVGLIPAVIISLLTGAFVSFFGGAVEACKDDPSCNVTINGQPVSNNDSNSNSNSNSDSNNSSNSNSNNNNSNSNNNSSNSSNASGWTYDFLKEKAEEAGKKISDVPQEYIDAFKDFEVCLDKAGIEVNSWEEFEELNEDEDNLTIDQALGLMGCAMTLAEATEDIDTGDLDLDL